MLPADAPQSTARTLILPPLLSVLLTVIVAAARSIPSPRFYFQDDTQTGAFGIWWRVGEMVLEGDWTLMSPGAWQAGNYIAEGQWGLLSPLMLLIGLGSHAFADAAIYASIVKIALLGAMALGVHLLARSYGASSAWAVVAATAAPLAGFTTYMDAPSWVTGLINSALFPFVWWGLRRIVQGANPVAYLAPMYLLVTAGYFAGVVMLAVLLIVFFLDRAADRVWIDVRRVVLAGAVTLGVTLAVFLPAILTSPVTERSSTDIVNTGNLNADLSDLLASASPVGTTTINGFWGTYPPAPLQYLAWFLPLFVLLLPAARRVVRDLVPVIAMLAVSVVMVVGPSDIGPLRYFARMLPYTALTASVIFAVLASRIAIRTSTGRVIAAAALVVTTNWAAWAQVPGQEVRVIVSCVLELIALAAVVVCLERRELGVLARWRPHLAAAVVTVTGILLLVPQAYLYRTSPLPDFAVPTSVEQLRQPLAGGEPDAATLVVGDVYAMRGEPTGYAETLVANLWYVSEAEVANLYTVLPFLEYRDDVCADWRSVTCADLFDTLLEEDPTTRLPVADLLAVDQLLLIADSFPRGYPDPAPGWHVAETGEFTQRQVRDEPLRNTGGVAWASDGLDLDVRRIGQTSVEIAVESVPTGGGEVVLSRLAWPGYTVDGAELADPTRGYLLTIAVPEEAAGHTVMVTFRPPGWTLEVIAFAGGLLGSLAWIMLHTIRARRGAHDESAASEDDAVEAQERTNTRR